MENAAVVLARAFWPRLNQSAAILSMRADRLDGARGYPLLRARGQSEARLVIHARTGNVRHRGSRVALQAPPLSMRGR
jgi:hypothetical protein